MWPAEFLRSLSRTIWRAIASLWRKPITTSNFGPMVVVEAAPELDAIPPAVVHIVAAGGKNRWAMFLCPCGCGEVITLSLQAVHSPHWKLLPSRADLPSLHPSIWRKQGCLSHFWIREGKVHWA